MDLNNTAQKIISYPPLRDAKTVGAWPIQLTGCRNYLRCELPQVTEWWRRKQ